MEEPVASLASTWICNVPFGLANLLRRLLSKIIGVRGVVIELDLFNPEPVSAIYNLV
jgi:hypothetical protein